MSSNIALTRAIAGVPATILWVLVIERRLMSIKELIAFTTYKEDYLRDAIQVLGPDGLGFIAVSVREHGEKFISLATAFQQKFTGNFFEIPVSEKSETDLSSSSNLTLIKELNIITTTTKEPVSEKSETELESQSAPVIEIPGETEQVRRILEATPILFGEPGVFTKGLHLDAIYAQVALGWVKQGWNAKNLLPCKQAGVVYNGLKSGEKPKTKFLYDDDENLPFDYLVAIGHRQKTCDLCGEKFSSLVEFEAHWKICVITPKHEVEPDDAEEPEQFINNPLLDEKRPDGGISINSAWQTLINRLQLEMPRASFETWVRDTVPYSWVESKKSLQIATRNSYAKDWLTTRLASTVERLLAEILCGGVTVEFIVTK